MKLIDILVKELPVRGGWPDGMEYVVQDSDGKVKFGKNIEKLQHPSINGVWFRNEPNGNPSLLLTCCEDWLTAIVTREQYEAATTEPPATFNCRAHQFLEKGVQHMKDRAAQRDSEDGERSMKATVDAFNAMFGHKLTETQGWQFMVLLKMARSRNKFNPDDYEDGAAYTGLAGEAHSNEQN